MDLKDLVECYNDNLKLFIDKHCPPATKSFHQRPYSRWYNEKLQNKKRKTRAAERKKNKSGSLESLFLNTRTWMSTQNLYFPTSSTAWETSQWTNAFVCSPTRSPG